MEDLNERQIQILRLLAGQTEPLRNPELARRFGCSIKTIQRDFKRIEILGLSLGYTLLRSSQGIVLDCGNADRGRLNRWIYGGDRLSAGDSVEDRRRRIYLGLLLNAPQPTTIRSLSEAYYVGSSSIVNDLAAIEQRIREAGLTLNRTREGTYITGGELTIRNEVAEVLNQSRHFQLLPPSGLPTRLNEENRMVLSGIYGAQSLRQVEQCVGEIEEAIGVILGDIYYINIVTHILIAMERMRSRRYINPGGVMNPKLINPLIYEKIAACIQNFSQAVQITFPPNELLYIYTHFMGCGVGELPQREVIGQTLQGSQPEVLAFCEELIQRMEAETQVHFSQDANLFYSLLLHINSMITRIQYNVRIVCLLKEKTIAEFPQMYAQVKTAVLELKQKYYPKHFISEDELCYLCLYFQLALEPKTPRQRVLLVCSTGIGTSHLLKKRVATVFPELEIVDVISLRQLKHRKAADLDFILTTVGIDFEISCPSVTVSALLDSKDIEEVRRLLNG